MTKAKATVREAKIPNCNLKIKIKGNDNQFEKMASFVERIASTPSGLELTEKLSENNFELSFAKDGQDFGNCDIESRKIEIPNNMKEDKQIYFLIHEARHGEQFSSGLDEKVGDETLTSAIIKKRSLEADADAVTCLVCYEMSEFGDRKPLEEFENDNSHISKAFFKVIDKQYPEDINKALEEAFKASYNDSKHFTKEQLLTAEMYEKDLIECVENASKNKNNKFSKQINVADHIKNLCKFEENGYFKDNPNKLKSPKCVKLFSKTKDELSKYLPKDQISAIPNRSDNEENTLIKINKTTKRADLGPIKQTQPKRIKATRIKNLKIKSR